MSDLLLEPRIIFGPFDSYYDRPATKTSSLHNVRGAYFIQHAAMYPGRWSTNKGDLNGHLEAEQGEYQRKLAKQRFEKLEDPYSLFVGLDISSITFETSTFKLTVFYPQLGRYITLRIHRPTYGFDYLVTSPEGERIETWDVPFALGSIVSWDETKLVTTEGLTIYPRPFLQDRREDAQLAMLYNEDYKFVMDHYDTIN